jgi:hypothetical protein
MGYKVDFSQVRHSFLSPTLKQHPRKDIMQTEPYIETETCVTELKRDESAL